ncbi:hypothetical protein IQ244_21785 [Nostoc sp. LEGE 06077]|uniref:hypothetical protein n=1 Tax=Nostoc sp. LEGE 06077 TaxID=915325 RepID=UPI0018816F12|nr:hypothetical protein [Nostoc sp. LEGE 06077]MBE9209121.1 hypothetical protein [Nostoc sp. LEGE 06077]
MGLWRGAITHLEKQAIALVMWRGAIAHYDQQAILDCIIIESASPILEKRIC